MTTDIVTEAQAYWDRIRRDRVMPGRADLDPVDIPKLLPFVMLVEVLRNPLDFKFRLIGDEIIAIIAHNYRGMLFSQIPHMAAGNGMWQQYAEVAKTGRPLVSSVSYVGPDRYVRSLRHCLLPLSADGQIVSTIFAALAIRRAAPPP